MRREPDARRHDPRWNLALEIAGRLWLYGEHVLEIERLPTQAWVDAQWAAHQAGRLIGVKTRLEVSPAEPGSNLLLMRITYVDPDGQGLIRAQDGLDSLVRAVRDELLTDTRLSERRPWQPPSSPA